MCDVRIGSEDCSVNDVVTIISTSESISQVYEQWTDLATKLNLPKEFVDDIRRKIHIETLKYHDILPSLLHKWIAQDSDKATLFKLITAFKNCNLNSTADLLARKYIKPNKDLGASSTTIHSLASKTSNKSKPDLKEDCTESQETKVTLSRNSNNGCGRKSVTRRLLQRASHICTSKTGRKLSICVIFRKAKICIAYNSFRCCRVFWNTFAFTIPLFLVLCFIHQVVLKPIVKTTFPNNTKTADLAFSSINSSNLTSTVVPYRGTFNESSTSSSTSLEVSKFDAIPNTSNVFSIPTTVPSWFSVNASVESWHDLLKLMSDTKHNEEIELTINFDNLFEWGDKLILHNSHRIKSLWIRGHISLDSLADMVNQMPLLQNLVLDNSEDKLCARNKGQLLLVKSIPENAVRLPILEKLWLKDFSSCVEILESLVRSYDCKQLKSLAIEEHIDTHNIHHVQELIAKYRSIKSLELYFVNSSNNYFYKNGVRMDNLVRLNYNMLSSSDSKMSKILLGQEFCNVFGNILHFKIGTGCIPYKDMKYLLHCDKLKSINIVICFDNDDILSDISLHNKLNKLENIFINLQFADPLNCPSIAKIRRLGLNSVGKRVRKSLTVSNCPIKRDKAGIEYKSDFKQFRVNSTLYSD